MTTEINKDTETVRLNFNVEKEKYKKMKKILIDKETNIKDYMNKCIDELIKNTK